MELTLGDRIRQARKGKMTQSELAESLGLSDMTIRRWEAGTRIPNAEDIKKTANVLGVPLSELIGEETDGKSLMENNQSSERKQNMAVLTFKNGEKIEAPATPEGYSFLKELFAMSLGGQPAMA